MTKADNYRCGFSMVLCIGLMLMLPVPGLCGPLWIEDLSDALTFYQNRYPEGNWNPYVQKLSELREGVDHSDGALINRAIADLLKMLRLNASGINGIAAHGLYWIVLGLQADVAVPASKQNTDRIG